MKKKNNLINLIIIIIIIISVILYLTYPKYDHNKSYVNDYIVGAKGIKGNVDISNWGNKKSFEIGVNKEGYAVFRNPDKALRQIKIDYSKGIAAIQKEFFLLPISRWNYKKYRNYGWQLKSKYDLETIIQSRNLSSFLDIYDNSF
jgi:uncharacterized protein YxeA